MHSYHLSTFVSTRPNLQLKKWEESRHEFTAPIVDNRCWISLRLTSGYQVWSAVQILFEFGLSLVSLNASLRSSQKGWKFTEVLLLVRQSGISKTSASYSSWENNEWVAQQNSTQRRIYIFPGLLTVPNARHPTVSIAQTSLILFAIVMRFTGFRAKPESRFICSTAIHWFLRI